MQNENQDSSGRSKRTSVWVVIIGVAVTSLLGYSFFRAYEALQQYNDSNTGVQQNNTPQETEQDLIAGLEQLHPSARPHAENYLRLIRSYSGIAGDAARLGTDNGVGAGDVVNRLQDALQIRNDARSLPNVGTNEQSSLDQFANRAIEQYNRMRSELNEAGLRISASERSMIREATDSFTARNEHSRSTTGPAAAMIN